MNQLGKVMQHRDTDDLQANNTPPATEPGQGIRAGMWLGWQGGDGDYGYSYHRPEQKQATQDTYMYYPLVKAKQKNTVSRPNKTERDKKQDRQGEQHKLKKEKNREQEEEEGEQEEELGSPKQT